MAKLQLPNEVFELTLAYPDDSQLSVVRLTSTWLKYACGRQYKRRSLKCAPTLAAAVSAGLAVPSWYRLHRALNAPQRGIQSGRRLNLRSILQGDHEWLDFGHAKLSEFVLLGAAYRGGLGAATQQQCTFQHRWSQFDGTLARIPITDNKPVYSVATAQPHKCDQKCSCNSIWKELQCQDGWSAEYCKWHLDMSVYHPKLGFAQWLDCINPYGIDHLSLTSSEQGSIQLEDIYDSNWWQSERLQQAVASGETLRFCTSQHTSHFADNIDICSGHFESEI